MEGRIANGTGRLILRSGLVVFVKLVVITGCVRVRGCDAMAAKLAGWLAARTRLSHSPGQAGRLAGNSIDGAGQRSPGRVKGHRQLAPRNDCDPSRLILVVACVQVGQREKGAWRWHAEPLRERFVRWRRRRRRRRSGCRCGHQSLSLVLEVGLRLHLCVRARRALNWISDRGKRRDSGWRPLGGKGGSRDRGQLDVVGSSGWKWSWGSS